MATGLALAWEGLAEFEARLRAIAEASEPERQLAGLLFKRGEAIMGISKRLVPVDTGVLRSSGHVRAPIIRGGGNVEVELVYGGPAQSYATIVHEDLSAFHKVGQAKYLEQPFLAERNGTLAELAGFLRQLVAAGRIGRGLGKLAPRGSGRRGNLKALRSQQSAAQAVGRALRSLGRSSAAASVGNALRSVGGDL